jgi:hypothetical protein
VSAVADLERRIKVGPHLSEPVTGIMQDGLTVPETGHLKVQSCQLFQAALALFEVFISHRPTKSHNVHTGICCKQHSTVFRP